MVSSTSSLIIRLLFSVLKIYAQSFLLKPLLRFTVNSLVIFSIFSKLDLRSTSQLLRRLTNTRLNALSVQSKASSRNDLFINLNLKIRRLKFAGFRLGFMLYLPINEPH